MADNDWLSAIPVVGGLLSGIGGLFGESSKEKAQRQANEAQMTYQLGLLGEGGRPVSTPYYGGTYESGTLFPAAKENFNLWYDQAGPTVMLPQLKQTAEQYKPLLASQRGYLGDVFSGKNTDNRLAWNAPVNAARTNAAMAQKQTLESVLENTNNRLRAISQKQGFTGGSKTQDSALFNASLAYRNQAAQAMADADLANRMSEQAIRERGLQELGSLAQSNIPSSIAQAEMNLGYMPYNVTQQQLANALSGFSFFNPKGGASSLAISPVEQTNPWQYVAGGLSEGARAYGNYLSQQEMADAYRNWASRPELQYYDWRSGYAA